MSASAFGLATTLPQAEVRKHPSRSFSEDPLSTEVRSLVFRSTCEHPTLGPATPENGFVADLIQLGSLTIQICSEVD